MNAATLIQQVYVSLFGRPGDIAGVDYWSTLLAKDPSAIGSVFAAFVASPEYQKNVAGKSNAEIVASIHQNMLGHAPSQAWLDQWSAELGRTGNIGALVDSLASSAQGADLSALQAKLALANSFTQSLDTAFEAQAYASNPNIQSLGKTLQAYVVNEQTLALATSAYSLRAIGDAISTNSSEWTVPKSIEKQVQELYVAYFSRAADPKGLAYWSKLLDGDPANPQLAKIAATFAASPEYKEMYAQSSTTLKVAAVYEHLFGRTAEVAGLDYWAALLDQHLLNFDKMVTLISQAARGTDLAAYHNKVEVAQAISAAIDTPYESLSYAGVEANQKVAAYLAQVKDAQSYAAAMAPAAIDALIASLAPNNPGPVPPPPANEAVADLIGVAHPADHPLF